MLWWYVLFAELSSKKSAFADQPAELDVADFVGLFVGRFF